MKRHIAHGMRRVARVLIAKSNKLDPPKGLDLIVPGAEQAAETGRRLAERAIAYGGQLASAGVAGLVETFDTAGKSAGGKWAERIATGLAGAHPALPNAAATTIAHKPRRWWMFWR